MTSPTNEFPLKIKEVDDPLKTISDDLKDSLDSFIKKFNDEVIIAKDGYDKKCDTILTKLNELIDTTNKKLNKATPTGISELNLILEERNLETLQLYLKNNPDQVFNGQEIPLQTTLLSFIQQVSILLQLNKEKRVIVRILDWLEVVFDQLDESDPIVQHFLVPVLDSLQPSIIDLSNYYPKALLIHHFIRKIKNENIEK